MSGEKRATVRPTKRCLADLGLNVPSLREPLHDVEHVLIQDAQHIPERHESGGLKRVVKLKDIVWFKSRVSRWRGASTKLSDADLDAEFPENQGRWWMGAAGWREGGSKDDFYEALEAEAIPDSSHLLPVAWDTKRLTAELGVAWERHVRETVLELVARSIKTGHIVEAEARHHRIAALVRAKNGEDAYLVVCAEGIPDPRVIAIILSSVPGVPQDFWQPEPGHVAGIDPGPGQIVFSTIMPPAACAAVLDAAGDSE